MSLHFRRLIQIDGFSCSLGVVVEVYVQKKGIVVFFWNTFEVICRLGYIVFLKRVGK